MNSVSFALSIILILSIHHAYGEPINRIVPKFEPLIATENYTHYLDVDEVNIDQYKVFWKLLDNDEMQFEVHCKTTGWVGLGISPNGGMKGADIAIGWIDGQAHLKDCHASDNTKPELDSEQNWILLDGSEYNGYTMLKYKRSLKTCDAENDREIKQGTSYMIFAWNDADPINNDWKYHGKNKIIKQALLLNYKGEDLSEQSVLPPNTKIVDFRMRNVSLVPQETFYYCDFYKLPTVNEKIHLLQFEMLIKKANQHLVHHLLAYDCDDGFEPTHEYAQECGYKNLPNQIALKCQQRIFIAWGIGGQYNYSFPKQAGYPLFGGGKSKTIMVELHYNNPDLIEGLIDDTGVRLYYSSTLRKHDLGLLMLGAEGSPLSLQIPPQIDSLTYSFQCYPECSEKFYPDDGIYAVSGFLHTHLAGRSIRTKLVRKGVLVQYLFENLNYDFNYQYLLDVEPTKLMKGDALITECEFNTKDRSNFTTFGFGTRDEMCYSFIYYYPRIPELDKCFSEPSAESIIGFYRLLMNESFIPYMDFQNNNIWQNYGKLMTALANLQASEKLSKMYKTFFENDYRRSVTCGSGTSEAFDYFQNPNMENFKPTSSNITEKLCDPTTASANADSTTKENIAIIQTTTSKASSFNKIIEYNLYMFVIALTISKLV